MTRVLGHSDAVAHPSFNGPPTVEPVGENRPRKGRMNLTILTGLTGLAVLAFILELLRRRKLQEKYAVLWILVAL